MQAPRFDLSVIALATLAALSCGLVACGQSDVDETPRHRLLIVGWDGASFRMIDRLRAAGRIPNVTKLMENGVNAELESTVIPLSSAAWTSAVTGKGPGETGVYTFFEPVEGTYDVRLISSRSNRAAPIWRILTGRGLESVVFGVPITYPPEPITGTMVTGMLSPFRADYAWPPGYADELRALGFEPDLEVWMEMRTVDWGDFEKQLTIKEEVLGDLLGNDDWDFAMIVFKSLDVVSHLAYDADFYEHVGPVYDRLDSVLGGLLDIVGPETNVMLVSDHGFTVYDRGMNLHAWLIQSGFSVPKEHVKRFDIREEEPYSRRKQQMIRQLRNELDWTRTRAFASETEGNFGSIRLNVVGREAEGCVEREDIDALLEEITRALHEIIDPTGATVVTRVFRGAEMYPGRYADLIPDLLFEVREEYQVFSDIEEEGVLGPYVLPLPDHDRAGIFIAAGPSIARIAERRYAAIADVAPTALHLLGLPVYTEMTGIARLEFVDDGRPLRRIREADDPGASPAPEGDSQPFTARELKELEERLGSLGYGD